MDKPRILIVDDDDAVSGVLNQIITALGMTCDVAENGREGIEKLRVNYYDLILTDITMPVMDGLNFLREIRDITPFVPVAIITGYPTFENAVEAMKAGARDFIVKPFNVDKIKTTIERLMKEKRLIGNPLSGKEDIKRELIKRLQEIAILQSISSELDEIYENRTIYERIVEMVSRLVMAKEVTFGIIKNGFLKIEASTILTKKEIPISEPFEKIIKNKAFLIINQDERNPYNGSPLKSQLLLIPLVINNEVFGILGVSNKIDESTFSEDEIYLIHTLAKKVSLRIENNTLYELFYNNLLNALRSLIASIEARDSYTKQHSERVTKYALEIAEVMGLNTEDKESIQFGGYLHDIGKIGVRDTILLKLGKLTEEEMAEIRQHPVIGESIVKPLRFLPAERELILHHHERYDGKGYPYGLAGERIPLLARILAVADTYDAMTSTRPYRPAMSHEYAIEELKSNSGSQFDPQVVKAFLQTKTGRRTN